MLYAFIQTPMDVNGERKGSTVRRIIAMAPITGEMNKLMSDPAEIDRLLGEGAARAREIAAPILAETYEIVGLIR